MKVVIDPGSQLTFRPINSEIKSELELREGNKDYIYNLTPFVRVSCLQEVAYTEEEKAGKKNNLKDIRNSILTDATRFNGFQFTFDSDFDQAYGEVQKIGKTLDNVDVNIKNPRRVPPPSLNTFTAAVGEGNNYFTTAQLSFTCNSLEQLQFLTPFLFNPGNTIFVEFGHNTEKLKNNISLFDADDAQRLIESSITYYDCDSPIEEGFIERMNKRIFESGGAYDFFYGIVNNFNFDINDSLGFDCTVDLISASSMKLKADMVDSYNSVNSELSEVFTTTTLNSLLKYFRESVERENERTEKDIIFSFTDTFSSTYIRLGHILSFINGDYNIPKIDSSDARNLISINYNRAVSDGTSTERLNQRRLNELRERENISSFRPSDNKVDITAISNIGPRPVKEIGFDGSEPPAVSYSDDVLLFRERMWNPNIKYNNETGTYSLIWDRYSVGQKYVKKSSVSSTSNLRSDTFDVGGATGQQFTIDFGQFGVDVESIEPVLMGDNVSENEENLNNIYINFSKFKNIYISSKGKKIDVLKKLKDLINEATDNIWELSILGEGITPSKGADEASDSSSTDCEKSITTIMPLSVSTIDNTIETYTFKANSKNSVFNSFDYGLGLEGLLGDQIYMNALNSSNGSGESQKLNLLLFSNHENNLEIIDKRNKKVEVFLKEQESKKDNNTNRSEENTSDSIVEEIKAGDLRNRFGARLQFESNSTADPSLNSEFFSRINIGTHSDNPEFTRLEDIRQLQIQDKDGQRATPQTVINGLKDLYELKNIPLTFEPIKETIRSLRGVRTDNVQSDKEKLGEERERSFKKGGINPLLESTGDITMPGIGGINPLEYVKVNGIPDVYANRGQFCIMNVAHTITPTNWETQISTRFRPTYEDER